MKCGTRTLGGLHSHYTGVIASIAESKEAIGEGISSIRLRDSLASLHEQGCLYSGVELSLLRVRGKGQQVAIHGVLSHQPYPVWANLQFSLTL